MMSHPYEYRVLVEYINPEEDGRSPHFSHKEDQEGLQETLNDVVQHLPESIPEGWELNSHNITISRSTMIVTLLLRRPVSG
jgi:hypothetical protein